MSSFPHHHNNNPYYPPSIPPHQNISYYRTSEHLIPTIPHQDPQSPIPGDISTYPQILRDALERCNTIHQPNGDDTIYQVIEDTKSTYMNDTWQIIETYNNAQEANERAVYEFLFEGYWESGTSAGEVPEVEVSEDGMIQCAILTDGSMGGYTTISVQPAKVKGSKRSKN